MATKVTAYQSLYRKYRPQRFSELVGQEHVTTALRNAVREERVAHAYLFSGPRGTGKTTTARIIAKALNCTSLGSDGEPCDKCDACREIANGSSLDVVEIDAASRSKVEEMRDLLERVAYRSAGGRKVYIVDEVHMLSASAEAALLKTLEEPPEHVVFVLATTDPQKVAPTVRSRTQHYEFMLLTTEQLAAHLADILQREGVSADAEALAVVARRAAGSVRDALSLLDQALAHGERVIDATQVGALFGGAPSEQRVAVLDAVAAQDVASVLAGIADLTAAGADPRRIAEDLLSATRDAFLITAADGRVRVDVAGEDRERLATLGKAMGVGALVRVMETLGQAIVDMRGVNATDPRLTLEVALVRLARRDAGPPLQALSERVERLEQQLADGVPVAVAPAPSAAAPSGPSRAALGALRQSKPPAPKAPAPKAPEATEEPAAAPKEESTGPIALDDVILAWAELLPTLSVATRSAVQEAQPIEIDDDVVVFGVPPRLLEAARPRFQREAPNIRNAFAQRVGRTLRFRLVPQRFDGADVDLTDERPVQHDEEEHHIDPEELIDAPAAEGAVDSLSRLVDTFEGVVVEERPRD